MERVPAQRLFELPKGRICLAFEYRVFCTRNTLTVKVIKVMGKLFIFSLFICLRMRVERLTGWLMRIYLVSSPEIVTENVENCDERKPLHARFCQMHKWIFFPLWNPKICISKNDLTFCMSKYDRLIAFSWQIMTRLLHEWWNTTFQMKNMKNLLSTVGIYEKVDLFIFLIRMQI